MVTVKLMLAGIVLFTAGAATLGTWLRKHASKINAERTSRIMHALFFLCLGLPAAVGLVYPGLRHFDDVIGISPLPRPGLSIALGILLALPGLYLLAITNQRLRALGSGANAFRLTQRIVDQDIYERTRNPMSLGYYLLVVAVGLLAGSSSITLAALLGVIPAHLFFLKYFEEFELRLRFGEPYEAYRRDTPFLIPRMSAQKEEEPVP